MSGGVDSAVAAGLLLESGYDVVGITMKMYTPSRPAHAKSCCGIDDFDDARASAAMLGIPHYVLDFEEVFRRDGHRAFRQRLRTGTHAQPVRFVQQLREARHAREIRRLARRALRCNGSLRPHRASRGRATSLPQPACEGSSLCARPAKPAQLARLLLPLGEFDKATTRAHARRLGLPIHDKAESQDICFVEGGDYRAVLARLHPEISEPGAVVASTGAQVGAHTGIANYTVGQRAQLPASSDGARYVTRIEAATQHARHRTRG